MCHTRTCTLPQERSPHKTVSGAGETPLVIASKFKLVTHVRRPGVALMTPTLTAGQSTPVAVVGSLPWTMEEIHNKEPEIARLLLGAGADPNAADPDGLTPLMFAAGQGRLELVQVLLAGGADVEARTAEDITAWQVATGEEVIRALWEARGRR